MTRHLLSSLFLLSILFSATSYGHLLNMTEVRATVDGELQITIDLEIDLLAEFGSAEGYYLFSQTEPEALFQNYQQLLNRLANSIQVTQEVLNSDLKTDLESAPKPVALSLVSITPPVESKLADFESDFNWPMTEIRLQGQIPATQESSQQSLPIRIQFQPSFVFEEPIALTMYSSLTEKSKSRWLVTGQTSPRFEISPNAGLVAGGQTSNTSMYAEVISRLGSLIHYARFGFQHILPDGWDHLLFVLLIYISTRTKRELLGQISIFTLAHSLTLILASYRVVEINALFVEASIALSIFFMATRSIFVQRKRSQELYSDRQSKWFLTGIIIFLFGLLHGLGFANSLNALDLPSSDFLASLISFNIGVEIGQICFVIFLALVIGRFKRKSFYQDRVSIPISAVSAVIALLWTWLLIS